MSKTYVIGDIHGAYKALIQCLERSPYNPEEDTLIQLGDVADGWSQTPEVVRFLIALGGSAICIRGNHDQWTNEWFQTGVAQEMWVQQGGQATKDAYENKVGYYDFDVEAHRKFFRNQVNYYIDEENRVFIHGGYMSEEGCGKDNHESVYYWNRKLWNTALSGSSTEMPRLLRPHKEIFIGHTSTVMWNTDKPMNACNVWNLDTGGGWHGKVTIMDVDSKEYWQSDLCKDLYPDERGR